MDHPLLGGPGKPVISVRRSEAIEFCAWAGLRLPSETEWEYACRAGTGTPSWFSSDPEQTGPRVWSGQRNVKTAGPIAVHRAPPRGAAEGNSSSERPAYPNPWGLLHTLGNVAEICRDDYRQDYGDDANPVPVDGTPRLVGKGLPVHRGGSWYARWQQCRSAARTDPQRHPQDAGSTHLGFRAARSVR